MAIDIRAQIKLMNNYRDKFGMITQANKDGGDTANRTGAYYIYLNYLGFNRDDRNLPNGFAIDLWALEHSPGRYVRHPDPDHWYSNPNNFSRDQSILLQGAMTVCNQSVPFKEVWHERLKRCYFHFNTEEGDDDPSTHKTKIPDPPAPIEWSQYIRSAGHWWAYPFLLLTDFQFVIDAAVTRHFSVESGNKDFDSNYLPLLLSCSGSLPTPWIWLAKRLYQRYVDVPDRLRVYYAEGSGLNGLAPLGELAVAAFEKLQGKD